MGTEQRRHRRGTIIVSVLAVAILGAIALYAWHQTFGYWWRLDNAVDAFDRPDGFTLLDEQRLGTTWCVISCDEARITLLLGSDLDPRAVCDEVRASLTAQYGKPEPTSFLGCGFEIALESVGSGATVHAGARPADEVATIGSTAAYDMPINLQGSTTLVYVVFSSGID